MITARLRELAPHVAPGPWRTERSGVDGALVLWDADGVPLALVYGGIDLAHYLEQCAPTILLDDDESEVI